MRATEFIVEQDLDEGIKSKAAAAALAAAFGGGAQGATDYSVLDQYRNTVDAQARATAQPAKALAKQAAPQKTKATPFHRDDDPIGQLVRQRAATKPAGDPIGQFLKNQPTAPVAKAEPKKVEQPKAEPKKAEPAKKSARIPEYVPVTDNPFEPRLKKFAMKHGIADPTELAQFLAQSAHETAGFTKLSEDGDREYFFKLYDPKGNPSKAKTLGNTERGDGERFKGRGFLHLTGRDNYTRASQAIFGDDRLVQHPEMVATNPTVAAQTAIWFWNTNLKKQLGDRGFKSTKDVTRIVNPGMRHSDRRVTWADKFLSALGIKRG